MDSLETITKIKEPAIASHSKKERLFKELIKKHGSPLMLIKEDILEKQYNVFCDNLPEVKVFFAIKSNPDTKIIEKFAKLGASFDVASATEMKWALDAGVEPERIIFANTIKSVKDLQYAYQNNVDTMTYDNETELKKIAKYCPRAKVVLRIRVDNVGSIVDLSLKFGAEPDEATSLLLEAQNLGLDPCGLSFHVGSQCANEENYLQALEVSSAIFYEAKGEGINMRILDIGGGFPIKHWPEENVPSFQKMARKIRTEIARLFYDDVEVLAEPGRFLVGPAGTLLTQVIGKTYREEKNFYYLNDGLYADFSGIVFDHCKYKYKTFKKGKKYLSTLAGPTCDSFDTISLSEDLPLLDLDDIVYVENIGAYSSASAVQAFNGIASANVIMI